MKPLWSDLLVAGGGVAGCCAAIAAARSGVRTLLVERQGYAGGTGYAGLLQHICGLYLNGGDIPTETLNGGLTEEIVALLLKKAPHKKIRRIGQVYVLPYASEDLQDVLQSLMEAETALTVRYNAAVTGVEAACGTVRGVTVATPGGKQALSATVVIDCTGTGEVAARAGAEFELSPVSVRQLAGFSVKVSGLVNGDDTHSLKVPYYAARAVEQNILPQLMRFTTYTHGENPGEGCIKMSLDGEDSPERDQRALDNAHALLAYLGQVVPAFKHARITATARKVLEREDRRIIGAYMLTAEDVLAARKFPDALVKSAWPIELWDPMQGTMYKYVPRGDYYEIPFRCITVRGMTNLLTAGRCISVSPGALGSTRVMGTCMALGEQAGLAGAKFIRTGEYPLITTGRS